MFVLVFLARAAQAAGPDHTYRIDQNMVRLDIQHPLILEIPESTPLVDIARAMDRDGREFDARFMRRTQSPIWVHFTVDNPMAT
ncbi:MAG TPA: hypothetical protein VE954_35105 [Oligoflexus sp.]|uniref:hypothetical protein n=1 Tax=Oligoflexus sp. TaxID=1971216 RepID=UPI002D3E8776|nr:hypothetical protein [Oligoflexus sp.]HYX38361.1 hypothetical protein [Oligoflexus sp.]